MTNKVKGSEDKGKKEMQRSSGYWVGLQNRLGEEHWGNANIQAVICLPIVNGYFTCEYWN